MLFKDQCVSWQTVSGYTETDTEITSVGYRILVDNVFVTEMRLFRNIGSVNTYINCENVIDFGEGLFIAYLQAHLTSGGVYNVPTPTKTVKIRFYDVVFNKTTGVTTETAFGENTMNNVIDGKFGNYFPQKMINQTTSQWVMLTNKYKTNKKYYISDKCSDVLTIFVNVTATVTFTPLDTGSPISATYTNGMRVISLNATRWGSTSRRYSISITTNTGNDFYIEIEKSEFLNNRPIKSGSCYEDEGDATMNLFFKHPMGGLDNIGNVNLVSVSGSPNRTNLRLSDTVYIHGGSANDFETTTQAAYKFSLGHSHVDSEGVFSGQYEAFITDVSELWIAALASCKAGFLVKNDEFINTIVGVNIDSVSASRTEIEGGLKVWQLSVSLTQKVPYVS